MKQDNCIKRLEALEAVVKDLNERAIREDERKKYRHERFLFWKDVLLVLCAVVGGLLGVASWFRS